MVALITLKMLNMVTGPTENQTYKEKERCQTRVVSNIDSTAPSVSGTDSILWVLISWYDLGMFSRSSWFHTLQPIPRKTCSMSWIQFPFPKSTPFAHSIVLNIKNPFSANFCHPRIVKLPWMHYQHGVHDFSQPVRLITLYSLSEVLVHNTIKPETQTSSFILPLSPVLHQQVLSCLKFWGYPPHF